MDEAAWRDRAGSDWFLRKLEYEPALPGRDSGYGGHYYHVPTFLARAPTGRILAARKPDSTPGQEQVDMV